MLKILNDEDKRAELITLMQEVGYGNTSGNVWTHIGSDRNKNLEGMLFDEVAADWGSA